MPDRGQAAIANGAPQLLGAQPVRSHLVHALLELDRDHTAAHTSEAWYEDLALELGVAPDRIDTIGDGNRAAEVGAKTDGNMAGARAAVLAELAKLIDQGEIEVPIAAVYPLDHVRDAYRELERPHALGKIVLIP